MRVRQISAFGRIYHQSSHLGDEFVLSTLLERVNLSYEGADLKLSYEFPYGIRIYGGGGGIFSKEPSSVKTWSTQYGFEYRSPWRFDSAAMRPIFALDIKNYEQNNWNTDVSARAGVQFDNFQAFGRKLQFLIEYFNGRAPTVSWAELRRQPALTLVKRGGEPYRRVLDIDSLPSSPLGTYPAYPRRIADPTLVDAPVRREEHGFGQELAGNAPEARAKGVTSRKLLHARARAHEHQVGDVDAAHQQHEHDTAPQQVECAADVADQVVLQRDHDGVEPRVDQNLLEIRKPIEVPRVERIDLLARLRDRSIARCSAEENGLDTSSRTSPIVWVRPPRRRSIDAFASRR